ncbi:MAG: thymidine phosphorylase [Spirochaetaceae bacterium]|nr:thymidine phosphorylase [Spirochaetaceae bacterium]
MATMTEIIGKKQRGEALSQTDIAEFINSYTKGETPDYQAAALLMAIYFKGMNHEETVVLTEEMAHSGDMIDLSAIHGVKVDKHSTGGVGDKTTLILAPIAAACGAKVAKMSGRGLGHTGGTIDKLESIPGFKTALDKAEFFEIVNRVGAAVVGATANIAPADKKIYALRDLTCTVASLPLISASIMSKKLASGADAIVLDVKCGSGAFMKTVDEAKALAQMMIDIGEAHGRKMAAFITDMDIPLGFAIGNALEVKEAVETLQGKGPADLTEICVQLAGSMICLAGIGTLEECTQKARKAISDGSGFRKFKEMIQAQGGDVSVIEDCSKLIGKPLEKIVRAPESAYISAMDTERCGIASMLLGAGRRKKEDALDYHAGIILEAKTGDKVRAGDVIARLYSTKPELFAEAEAELLSAYSFGPKKPELPPLVLATLFGKC